MVLFAEKIIPTYPGMKIDSFYLSYLARDLQSSFRGARVKAVLSEGCFYELDTTKGPLLISLYQPSPMIGRTFLPTENKERKLSQMIGNLSIETITNVEGDRIIVLHLSDRLKIVKRQLVVELIPNYAALLVLENENIIFTTKSTGAGKRQLALGEKYSIPSKPETEENVYHPLRRQIISKVPSQARDVLQKHLVRKDLPFMVVARDLAWPTPSAATTALDLASMEASRQIESYYENIQRKERHKEEQLTVQREMVNEQELKEELEKLKRWGQVLLSLPLDTQGEVTITDWVTGEETTVNLAQFSTSVEAAQTFFERARTLEKKLLASKANKLRPAKKVNSTSTQQSPYKRIFIDGVPIYIGLSASGNDFVTFSSAPEHWWFHVKEGTGSHVVVRSSSLTDDTARVAARIAAFHSSKSEENKVEVVYTQIKNVWRHPKNKKGLVLYRNFQIIIVEPASEETILSTT